MDGWPYGCARPSDPNTRGSGPRKSHTFDVGNVEGGFTREAQLEFCEANVRKPLASAVRVAQAGNGIWLDADGGYIVNKDTKERMAVRIENGVYVMDVCYDDDTVDVITLDSGAGCNVWPKGRRAGQNSKTMPKKAGVGMVAANGTPIEYHGQRQVRFRGTRAEEGFTRL